jgi:hypothetical protein
LSLPGYMQVNSLLVRIAIGTVRMCEIIFVFDRLLGSGNA